MKKRITLLPIILMFICLNAFSQENHGVCGSYKDYIKDDMQKYPAYYQSIESRNLELEKERLRALNTLSNAKSANQGKKIIPVVVHIIHDMGAENVSDETVIQAIDILNKNINGQSANFLAKTPDVFAASRGVADIEFRLATIAPDGTPTNGIVRVQSSLTNQPVPANSVKSLSYWNSFQYYNIWVLRKFAPQSDGNTLLGYAQFPGSGSMMTDGVVLIYSEFNDPGSSTLTHETGHWLGLCHPWDCGSGECGDDNIFDTPPAREANYGVGFNDFPYHVGFINQGCIADSMNWAGEMFMNYMDYTPDQHCTMFSKGQVEVFNEVLEGLDSTDFGWRHYIWQDVNLDATGVKDGLIGTACSKNSNFSENANRESVCLGEEIWLKSNKNIFGSGLTSVTWDLGDGSTSNQIDNILHTYSTEGTYDITFTVVYNETITAKAYNLADLDLTSASSYDSVMTSEIVQGTQAELLSIGATSITEHPIDSLGFYWGLQDSSFWRGEVMSKMYVAHYENSCTSTIVKDSFITVYPLTATNNQNSYSYNFENENDLENGEWQIKSNGDDLGEWSYNLSSTNTWQWNNLTASSGDGSLMIDASDNKSIGSDDIISQAYDLSSLNSPAIKFSWSGAAVNTFPVNTLNVYYSNDCGEVWRDLGSLTPVETSNSGYYDGNFVPTPSEWRDTVLSKNALKSDNIRFKFEYSTLGSSNNFYLDNIQIGEEADLSNIVNQNINARISIFPNPSKDKVLLTLDNLKDVNLDISIYNILGKQIMKVYEGIVNSNHHTLNNIDISKLTKGVYFISLKSNNKNITEKLIVK